MSIAKRSAHVAERILVVVLLIGLLLVPGALAQSCTTGITVMPSVGDGVEILRSIGNTIHPGEYQTIEKSVPSGVKTLKIYLDWSGHQHSGTDSLTLAITPPGKHRARPVP